MDLLFSAFWPVIDSTVTLNTSSSQLLWNTQRERISKKTLILPRLRSLSLSKNNNSAKFESNTLSHECLDSDCAKYKEKLATKVTFYEAIHKTFSKTFSSIKP